MTTIIALLSSALALTPAPTASISRERVHSVEADYFKTVAADGTMTLTGQDNHTGKMFRYIVRNGFVRGWVGNQPVTFRLSEVTAERD
jgi:hypothetical protein